MCRGDALKCRVEILAVSATRLKGVDAIASRTKATHCQELETEDFFRHCALCFRPWEPALVQKPVSRLVYEKLALQRAFECLSQLTGVNRYRLIEVLFLKKFPERGTDKAAGEFDRCGSELHLPQPQVTASPDSLSVGHFVSCVLLGHIPQGNFLAEKIVTVGHICSSLYAKAAAAMGPPATRPTSECLLISRNNSGETAPM